jgi:HSP20 family protein
MPWKRPHEVAKGFRDVEDFFDRFLSGFPLGKGEVGWVNEWVPRFDVREDENALVVEGEIPGLETKDIDISLEGNILTIRGEKKQETKETHECYHRVERQYGSFSRTLTLPIEIDETKVDAEYKNGVLRVVMPKTEEARKKTKKIEVH